MADKKKERIEVADKSGNKCVHSSNSGCGSSGQKLPSSDKDDETTCTFVLHGEDHTLGNSLRYMIMKNPDVEFCGYNIPHPSENKIHLRIQTFQTSNTTALDALKKGLKDLSGVCSHIIETFKTEVAHYKSTHQMDDEDGS